MDAAAAHAPEAERPTAQGHPFAAVDRKKLGMWFFLGSDAMGFTGLLGAYAVLRMSSGDHWQEAFGKFIDMEGSRNLTFFNTFLLICSSVTMVLSLKNLRLGNMGKFKAFLAATMLGGIGFLSCQAYEWTHLSHEICAMDPAAAAGGEHHTTVAAAMRACLFAGTFFMLTGYHGFHVFIGVVLLGWALVRGLRGVYSPKNSVGIEVVGLYWHFVDLIWILLFTLIYLLPGKGGHA
jgi:heme/copper-type cytochrome/quinol oxidase subunit 3